MKRPGAKLAAPARKAMKRPGAKLAAPASKAMKRPGAKLAAPASKAMMKRPGSMNAKKADSDSKLQLNPSFRDAQGRLCKEFLLQVHDEWTDLRDYNSSYQVWSETERRHLGIIEFYLYFFT